MALDTSNNSVLWSTDFTAAYDSDTSTGGLAISTDFVFASSCQGYIYVFSRETGAFITAVELPELPGEAGAVQWPIYLAVDTFVSPERLYGTVAAYRGLLIGKLYIAWYDIGGDGGLSFEGCWYELYHSIPNFLYANISLDFNSDFLAMPGLWPNGFRLHPRPVTKLNFTGLVGNSGNAMRLDDSSLFHTVLLSPTKLWYYRLSDGVFMGTDSTLMTGVYSWTLGGESPNGGEPPNGETTAKRAMWQPSPCGRFGHPMHPLGV